MSGLDGGALARVQTAARRANGAWNRHDAASLRDALMVARELGLQDVKLEYGGENSRSPVAHLQPCVALSGQQVRYVNDQSITAS